jgi:hypothetical protein
LRVGGRSASDARLVRLRLAARLVRSSAARSRHAIEKLIKDDLEARKVRPRRASGERLTSDSPGSFFDSRIPPGVVH